MRNTIFTFICFLILISSEALSVEQEVPSNRWSIHLRYTEPNEDNVVKSVVVLKKGREELKYTPSQPPWGAVSSKRFRLNGKYYFATVWPGVGARIVAHKIFTPDQHDDRDQLQVVCETNSASEDPELKVQGGSIMIKSVEVNESTRQISISWKTCTQIERD